MCVCCALLCCVSLSLYIFLPIGTLPSSFTNLSLLEFLYLNSNDLTGSSVWSAIAAELIELDLSSNSFSGAIPFDATTFSLENLYVRHNFFTGSIPTDVALLARVKILDLSFNLFTGTLGSQFNAVRVC